jgi:TRAP-type C4-dicarboxylate transport system permease small subunit
MSSYEFGDTLMKNTPAWMLQIILPIGFGLMAYRHLVFAIKRPFGPVDGPSGSKP